MEEDDYPRFIEETVKANYYNKGTLEELDNALREVVDLLNDVIDYWPRNISSHEFTDLVVRSAFLFSLLHIIWPLSNGVLIDLLVGNLPACFMQLRLIVETSAKALYTDYECRLQGISLHNIEELEKHLKKTSLSTTRFYKEKFSRVIGEEAAKLALSLWSRLSEDWLHLRGMMKKAREKMEKEGVAPSYMALLPAELDEKDAEDLRLLAEHVARTRELLKVLYTRWRELRFY